MVFWGGFVDGCTVQDSSVTFEYVLLFTQYLYDFFWCQDSCGSLLDIYPSLSMSIPLNIPFKLSNSEPIWTMFFPWVFLSHVQQDTILALQKELLDIFTAPGVQKKLREIRDSGAAGWKEKRRTGWGFKGRGSSFFCADDLFFGTEFGQTSTGCDPRDGLKKTRFLSRLDGFWMFLGPRIGGFPTENIWQGLDFWLMLP